MAKYKKKFRKKMKKAEILLTELAEVLDKCEREMISIKLRHGAVCSKYGYVLPFRHRWVVRMLIDSGYQDDDEED